MPGRNEIVPIAAAFILAALAAFLVTRPSKTDLPPPSVLAARSVPPVSPPHFRDHPAVLDAALFAPDRPRVPGVIDIAGTLEGYRLLGIAMKGHLVSAVIQGPGGAISRVAVGGRLDGWTMISADRSRLVFDQGKEQRVLLVNSN